MFEIFQNFFGISFLVEILILFLGLGAGFAISEYKEHRSTRKKLKNLRVFLLNDVSRIHHMVGTEPSCPSKRYKEVELEQVKEFMENKGNLINYHKRFDLSFGKGLLQTGTSMELEKDFFYTYMSFYQQVEVHVNSMELEYEKTKRDIAGYIHKYNEKILEIDSWKESKQESTREVSKGLDKETEYLVEKAIHPKGEVAKKEARELEREIAEGLIADSLSAYNRHIHANFYVIKNLGDKLPNPIKERLNHAFDSSLPYMKWNSFASELYKEGLKKYRENSENS